MNLSELKQYLRDLGYDEAIVFENPDYAAAAIGVTEDGRVVYSFHLMIECLVEEEDMTYEEALEFISYNTIRAIPYIGASAPVVMTEFSED